MQQIGYSFLPTVVIYLDCLKILEPYIISIHPFLKLTFKFGNNLIARVDILFIDHKTMIFEVNPTNKSHHTRKYLTAQIPVHELETAIGTNNGRSMETKICNTHRIQVAVQRLDLILYPQTLIMLNQCQYIKSGRAIQFAQDARFINKYA